MRKYTQKALRALVAQGVAQDITTTAPEELEQLKRVENGFDVIGTSSGVYGINGALLQGYNSGEWYTVTARNTNLFRLV